MRSDTVIERLNALRDEAYAEFSARLIPSVARERIIGVRLPQLRALARELYGTEEGEAFLAAVPHYHLEENTLHALIISRERELSALLGRLEAFLPYIDNWASCDSLRPVAFKKRFSDALPFLKKVIGSSAPYAVRFGIEMLMTHGLGEAFSPEFHALTAGVRSDEYYVNMMRAWYFATALAFRYDETLPYLKDGRLDPWTQNMTVKKALESFRISEAQKAELRMYRIPKERGAAEKARAIRSIEVVAAFILKDGAALICRRPAEKARGGQWEFPGGKVEAGETLARALSRECMEELNIEVRPVRVVSETKHAYPDISIRLTLIEAEIIRGTPAPCEHSELCFVGPDRLFEYDLCPADAKLAGAVMG